MKKSLLLALSFMMSMTSFAQSQANTTENSTTSEVSQISEKAAGIWIDVRSEEEFKAGHLENAINIPHDQIATQITSVTTNKDEPIHLYCRSGRRAESALQVLKEMGYTNITNHGGYDDLVKQGLK